MFNFDPVEDEFIACGKSGKLEYSAHRGRIGCGSNGTLVYEGRFESHPVAVKMIPKENFKGITRILIEIMGEDIINEAKILREYEHNNVIRYYLLDHDNRHVYLALELCKGNLAECIELGKPEKLLSGEGRHITKRHLLNGILDGLHYLHGADIIHGDLKPQNILLQVNKSNQGSGIDKIKYNAVISDFGLSLIIDPGRASKTVIDDLIGTDGWRPKEVVEKLEEFSKKNINGSRPYMSLEGNMDNLSLDKEKIKGTKHVDIFAFGCIIQYVMVEKKEEAGPVWYMHPFGDDKSRTMYIKRGVRVAYLSKNPSKNTELDELLADMLISLCVDKDPQCRPDTGEITKHPFFWEPSKRFRFIQKVANEVKPLPVKGDLRAMLNKKWEESHPTPYGEKIMSAVKYIAKYRNRKVDPNKHVLLDALLINMRNIKEHYPDIKKDYADMDILADLGDGNDDDFHRYFLQRIAQILPVVYTCYYKSQRNERGAYKEYFNDKEESSLIEIRERIYWFTLNKIRYTLDDNSSGKVKDTRKRARSRSHSEQT